MFKMKSLFAIGTDGQEVLYHGTSADWLRKIEVEGLKGPVYLSNDYETALFFAQQTACPSDIPVILEVVVQDVSLLRADLNMYDDPIKKLTQKYGVGIDDPLWEAVRAGRLRDPRDELDWETSLAEVGSAWYDGDIEQGSISFVRWGHCGSGPRKRRKSVG